MPATRLLILPSAGWPIDFNRNLNAFKLGLMVQKFVQIGAKVRAALHNFAVLAERPQPLFVVCIEDVCA